MYIDKGQINGSDDKQEEIRMRRRKKQKWKKNNVISETWNLNRLKKERMT